MRRSGQGSVEDPERVEGRRPGRWVAHEGEAAESRDVSPLVSAHRSANFSRSADSAEKSATFSIRSAPAPRPRPREGRKGARAPRPRPREGRKGARAPRPRPREGRKGARASRPRPREGRKGARAPRKDARCRGAGKATGNVGVLAKEAARYRKRGHAGEGSGMPARSWRGSPE